MATEKKEGSPELKDELQKIAEDYPENVTMDDLVQSLKETSIPFAVLLVSLAKATGDFTPALQFANFVENIEAQYATPKKEEVK